MIDHNHNNILFNDKKLTMNCIFCDKQIEYSLNKKHCDESQCVTLFKYKCKKILSCGHDCYLSCTSKNCRCLVKNCIKNHRKSNQNIPVEHLPRSFLNFNKNIKISDDIEDNIGNCIYCLENLIKFPLIELDCGHLFHHKCISSLFSSNKVNKGDNISLNFIKCCICFNKLSLSNHQDLQSFVNYYNELENSISNIIYEKIDQDEISSMNEIKDPLNKYFNLPFEWCKNKMEFYLCFKCEEPFYGGLKDCNENNIENDTNSKDKSNVVCINCIDSNIVQGKLCCELHGRSRIVFKCKFCCSEASHFCFGTTHFCEDCHLKQLNGELLTSKKIKDLPVCDPNTCFLKGNHPINGIEYSLGCELCDLK